MHSTSRLSSRSTPLAARLPSWAWLAVLLAALVAAPWLGAVHGSLHANGPGVTVATATSGYAPVGVQAPATEGIRRLFADHSHSGDCRIYDQLSHADGLHLHTPLPPVVLPPVAVLAWHAGECLRRWATLFDARGPPSCS